MKKLKVLHLASFEGNIGDNANHKGTRALLNKNLGFDIEYSNLEIREFYWNIKKYDESFVRLCNKHDVVMIGGGNYFELWVTNSSTGTSINISRKIMDKIKTPIVFYALGCDVGQGAPEENIIKFKEFLDYLISSSKYLISVRNDGSLDMVKDLIGEEYAKHIYKVPDGGFFTEVEEFYHPELPIGRTVIAVNLAGDMLHNRFDINLEDSSKISYERFLKIFGKLLNEQLSKNNDRYIAFIPHIYKDLVMISDILENVEDRFRRKRITVAPYLHGEGAQEYTFDLYRKCSLALANRFHANVCSIGMCVPTIGLINYPQIEKLYNELNLIDRSVKINENGFENVLIKLINQSLVHKEDLKKRYDEIKKRMINQINSFHNVMRRWIENSLQD